MKKYCFIEPEVPKEKAPNQTPKSWFLFQHRPIMCAFIVNFLEEYSNTVLYVFSNLWRGYILKIQKPSKKNLNQPLKRKVRVTDIVSWYVLKLKTNLNLLKFNDDTKVFSFCKYFHYFRGWSHKEKV